MIVHVGAPDTGEDSVVISSHGCWLPGVYADEAAGRAAFVLHHEALVQLRDRINRRGNRPITREDIRQARRDGARLLSA